MSPRKYNRARRQALKEEMRGRIVQAIVRLHARHGIQATSHAMIAKEADVSIPTVYNHFRTLGEVVVACGGHLATLVPSFDAGQLLSLPTLRERLAWVVNVIFRGYSILAPWMRWGRAESGAVPELKASWDRRRALRLDLLRTSLEPEFGSRPSESLLAIADALLDFSSWETLTQHHGLPPAKAEEVIADLLASEARRVRIGEAEKR